MLCQSPTSCDILNPLCYVIDSYKFSRFPAVLFIPTTSSAILATTMHIMILPVCFRQLYCSASYCHVSNTFSHFRLHLSSFCSCCVLCSDNLFHQPCSRTRVYVLGPICFAFHTLGMI